MALNRQVFITRTLTAAVFAVVMLLGLLWSPWSFLALFSLIHFGCWWEFLQLIERIHQTRFHVYTKLGMMVMGYGLMLWFCGPAFHIKEYVLKDNLSLPVSAAGFALLVTGIFQHNEVRVKAFVMGLLGLLYISLSWGLMLDLYNTSSGFKGYKTVGHVGYMIPLGIIVSIWINDTMAYIVGSLIGKTPLTKVSPKKTWEGTIGGMLLATVIIGLAYPPLAEKYMYAPTDRSTWFIIAATSAIAGTFGDLFESKLKRLADVKDSGSIMPGHGGFLDRFDSLLFAVPAVWVLFFFI